MQRAANILDPILSGTVLLLTLALGGCSDGEQHLALGTLERDRITLSATAAEIITAQPRAEGSHVETGELLVQLDDTQQQLAIARLEADIRRQQAQLEQLRNGARPEEIAAAQARLDAALAVEKENRRDLERIRELAGKQLAARAELDSAESRLESNAARSRDARAQLELLRAGAREEEIRQAEAQLDASRKALQLEQRRLGDLSVSATRSGTLDSLPFHVGERVALGAQLAVILSDDAPYARVFVPEPSRAALDVGDALTVHVDGADGNFSGTLRWIAEEPAFTPYYALNRAERSRLSYMAEVQLPDAAADLPSGLPLQVELP